MNTLKSTLVFVTSLVLMSACKQKNSDQLLLFQEQGTSWFEGGEARWDFENNELTGTASGASGFVMTKESYRNFELELEFYPDSTINSGVFVRCSKEEISNVDCYEMNIWDLHPDQKSRTGSVVTRAVPEAHVETLDKWNTYRILCSDDHIQTWVNGVLTIDLENQDLSEGYIALQAAEKGAIKFRNVRLKLLEAD
jgi:hypothetical protein